MNWKRQTKYRQWKVWKRAFRMWQQNPYRFPPMPSEPHVCQSCETEFSGNYCPCCGQSYRIGRFSFKTGVLMFLDTWGIGNRGMFRSIRDLMLRPGYMIRDYVRGRQSAYFPPFQMFFILAAFSLLLTHGFDIVLDETHLPEIETHMADSILVTHVDKDTLSMVNHLDPDSDRGLDNDNDSARDYWTNTKVNLYLNQLPKYLKWLDDNFPSLLSFLSLLFLSAPLYLFVRRCPAIPDLRYSEHIVALVFTSNTFVLYRIFSSLMPFGFLSDVFEFLALFMALVAMKQFTGYSKRRLILYFILAFTIFVLMFVAAVLLFYVVVVYLLPEDRSTSMIASSSLLLG